VWVRSLSVTNLRNIAAAELELRPGLNLLVGRNAQGKTSLLEAVALLARGRSFRTERLGEVVRRGSDGLSAAGLAVDGRGEARLEVRVSAGRRSLWVGGSEVGPRGYHGHLEALVYSTDRLRVVFGPMGERRRYFDRAAAALWPTYRQDLADYERVVAQRNAALERRHDLEPWDERLVTVGASLRGRRGRYLARLGQALERGFSPDGERYGLLPRPDGAADDEAGGQRRLRDELQASRRQEQRLRRTLVGPHRDAIGMLIDGQEAGSCASAGQARSLMLALTEAALEVYRVERGTSALALLDDLDSELDEDRASEVCRRLAAGGQALVTTAHAGWARRLGPLGSVFEVDAGRVRPA